MIKEKMSISEVALTNFKQLSKNTANMPGMTLSGIIQWSPLLQFIIVASGILTSFLIAYYRGDVNANLPFISETGAYSPEQCIFSLSLTMGSFIGCAFMIFRYLIIVENPLCDRRKFLKLNQASLAVGLFSMFGLAAVAAFPMTTVFWAHLLAAGIYFLNSSIYIILSTIISFNIDGSSNIFIYRFVLSVGICVFQLIMIIVFPIALLRWHEENDIIAALKTPSDKGFTLLLVASILEWSIVAIIVSYHLSFCWDMKSYKLYLKAKKVVPDAPNGDVAEVPV